MILSRTLHSFIMVSPGLLMISPSVLHRHYARCEFLNSTEGRQLLSSKDSTSVYQFINLNYGCMKLEDNILTGARICVKRNS